MDRGQYWRPWQKEDFVVLNGRQNSPIARIGTVALRWIYASATS